MPKPMFLVEKHSRLSASTQVNDPSSSIMWIYSVKIQIYEPISTYSSPEPKLRCYVVCYKLLKHLSTYICCGLGASGALGVDILLI